MGLLATFVLSACITVFKYVLLFGVLVKPVSELVFLGLYK